MLLGFARVLLCLQRLAMGLLGGVVRCCYDVLLWVCEGVVVGVVVGWRWVCDRVVMGLRWGCDGVVMGL